MEAKLAKLYAWYGTHARPKAPKRTPVHYQMAFEDISFPSSCNEKVCLRGWLIPVENPKAVVLLCHGVDANASCLLHKAKILNEVGFSTLLFDFRANGRSDGAHGTLGSREKNDVLGAIAYIKSRSDTKYLRIFALGESLGGSAIIRAAAESVHIEAVVSEATFATLEDAILQRLAPLGKLGLKVYERLVHLAKTEYRVDIKDVSPEAVVAQISPRPILFIVCDWDILCSRKESERLYAAAKEPKERWISPRSLHTFSCFANPKEYRKRVTEFFLKQI